MTTDFGKFKFDYKKFGGVLNGNNVIVKDLRLYDSGCYGKGSQSRSNPKSAGGISQFGFVRRLKINGGFVEPQKDQEFLILNLFESFYLLFSFGCLEIEDVGLKKEKKIKIKIKKKKKKKVVEKDRISFLGIKECWKLFSTLEDNFKLKYIVYHYFRSKGWVTRSGIKYGCDFVLYKHGPGIDHAAFCVLVKKKNNETSELKKVSSLMDNLSWRDVVHHNRLSISVAKNILLCIVDFKGVETKDLEDPTILLRKVTVSNIRVKRVVPRNKV